MLKNDNDIITDKLRQCFKANNFDDLHENIFNGRIDVARELVGRYRWLFEETALKTKPDGEVVEQTFVDYRKWSLPSVVAVLEKAGRRQLGL